MKTKLLLSALFSFSFYLLSSQVPLGFNYQAIARDGSGNPIVGATIKVKLSILTDTLGFRAGTGGTYLWEEEHLNVQTNAFGLFNIVLGDPLATKVDGSAASFSVINWSVADLYLGTKIANPTTYKVLGAAKLWSVPYALRAKDSDQWLTSGANIYRQTGNVGIGTNDPTSLLHVAGNARLNNSRVGDGIELMTYATGNRFAGIDFHGDDTFTDYALRIIRYNTGPDAVSSVVHRGLGELQLWTQDAAPISFYTTNNQRMTIAANGNVGIGTATPLTKLTITENLNTGITYPLYIQNASGDWTATEKGVGLKFGRVNPTSGHDYGTIRGTIASGSGALGRLQFIGGPGNTPHMTIDASGNVGIGTSSPLYLIDVNGGGRFSNSVQIGNSSGPITANWWEFGVDNGNGAGIDFHANSSANDFSARIYREGGNNGNLNISNAGTGMLQIGSSGGSLSLGSSGNYIQAPPTWDDNVPLFEVKNKWGTPVLAVYNNGVRILVAHDATAKGVTKGGFAIGGFDNTKTQGSTVNLMTVAPDSIRFNIDNDNTKGITKGGFAIGSFDVTKGINVNPKEFMNMTPLGSTTGQFNTFLGYQAGSKNISGIENTFIGYLAGYNITGAQYTVAIGKEALYQTAPTGLAGFSSVFIGNGAGKNGGGSYSVKIGNYAGENNHGGFNVFLGQQAGQYSTSMNSVFIGTLAGANETADNKLIIAGDLGNCKLITGNFGAGGSSYVVIAGTDPNSRTFFVNGSAGGWSAWANVSDVRFKKDIVTIPDALSKISQMRGVNFNWKDSLALDTDKQIGFIAQEVEKILPEVVSKDAKSGRLFLEYAPITALLVEAMKEQQMQIEEQQKQIESQNEKILQLELMMEEMRALIGKNGGK